MLSRFWISERVKVIQKNSARFQKAASGHGLYSEGASLIMTKNKRI